MVKINIMISLTLKKHCIETEIKKHYNRAVRDYFKAASSDQRSELEQRIELFKKALETLDFSRLRGRLTKLSGGTRQEVEISLDSAGDVVICVGGVPISLDENKKG